MGLIDHTIKYKTDKQQGLTVYYRERYYNQYLVITYNGKEYETESLCCTPETNVTL